MGNFTTLQDVDKFLATPLDKQKKEAPAIGPPPPLVGPPKKPLPEFKTVQDLDTFLKSPLQSYDQTPVKKWKEANATRERIAGPPPGFLSEEGLGGKAINLAAKIDQPIEKGIHWAEEHANKAIDWTSDLIMKPMRDQRDWLATHGYPTLAKLSAYTEAVDPVNWNRELFKTAAGMVVDPKNWPFLLEGAGTVRPMIKHAGTALFTVIQQYGAIQALQNKDWQSAAMQEAFALLGMKDLSLEVKAKVGEAALEKRLDVLAQSKYKKPWNQLTKPEQAGIAYDMANTPKPPVSAGQAAAMAAKGAGEPTAGPKAFDLASEQARGTAAARAAVPPQMMPTPEPFVEPPAPEKVPYQPVTGGTVLPQYLDPEEREAKGYYTLEEARKRLDEERRVESEAKEAAGRAEGERQRVSREKQEQAEGEAAYRAARAGGIVVKERRGVAFDEAGAERNRQEQSRLSDELNRIANENMYYDAEDMFQSLDTAKGRGKELEDWQKEALSLQNKLKDLERLSNPEILPPVRTANFEGLAEDTKLAAREGEMRDVASILDAEAKKVVGDVDEFEKLQAEADEAKDRAEKIRTERDEKEAKRAAETSERAEYPLGAPVESTRGSGGDMILPDGRKIAFHYAVVPMESVISSHDPFNNFEPNPAAIAVSQGRDYKNNRESQAATIARGKNPEMSLLMNSSPTAETGPPIIRSDGQALGGRNRVNIWKLLYRNGFGDAAYDYMAEHAREFGVTVEQIVNHKDPMVVRVLDEPYTSAEALAQLGRDLDRTQTMGFSDAETAVMAGRSLNTETLDWISNQLDAMGEDSTLRDLMRFRSGEIIDKMLASDMIEPTKRSEFVASTGEMTERAKDLFESAVLGKVIDDAELLATTPKEVLRKLERSVGALVRVKAAGGVWDFTPELKSALRLWKRVDSIRESLNKIGSAEDSLVDRYLHPGEYKMGTELIDFGGETAREQPHPTVEALAKLLEEPGKEIKLAVGDYADDAEGKQMTLGPAPVPVESFNAHIGSKVKVDVPDEAWGTDPSKAIPEPVEAKKEEATPAVPPPLEAPAAKAEEAPPAPLQAGGMTVAGLESVMQQNKNIAPVAKPLLEAMGTVVKNALGMDLGDFLKKAWADIKTEGTPGEGGMEQSAGSNAGWARGAGRKLTVTPFGEQLDLFGGAEPQFMLRDERRGVPDANKERLVLKSELLKLRAEVPRLSELVDAEGNLRQTQLFGPEEENLFGPGAEDEGGPQGTLFQTEDEKLAEVWAKSKSVGANETDWFAKAKAELFPGKTDLAMAEISQVANKAREMRIAAEGPNVLFQEKQGPWIYKSEVVLKDEKLPASQSGSQWAAMLRNKGVKADELKWMGIDDFLEGKKKVSKQELRDFIRENQLQVTEVAKSGTVDQDRILGYDTARNQLIIELEQDGYSLDQVAGGYDVHTDDGWIKLGSGEYSKLPESARDKIAEIMGLDEAIRVASRSGVGAATKYSQYTLPGEKKNYTELLLTLPVRSKISGISDAEVAEFEKLDKMDPADMSDDQLHRRWELYTRASQHAVAETPMFDSAHFDEPNVLAHVRFDERTDASGKRTLFIEEVQSDWHQKGKKFGYGNATKESGWESTESPSQAVPDAPFKTDWHEMVMKRMLREAAERGFDKVAWVTGEQTAARYDLSKQINGVEWSERDGDFYAFRDNHTVIRRHGVKAEDLPELIGKDIAQKLVAQEVHEHSGFRRVSGLDLKTGGEWAKALYDNAIPNFMRKYGKKWNAKVQDTKISGERTGLTIERRQEGRQEYWAVVREGVDRGSFGSRQDAANFLNELREASPDVAEQAVHSMDISPEMKKSVMEGQPLFQTKKGATEFLNDGKAVVYLFENADASTFLHEFFHVMCRYVKPEDLKVLEDWQGVKDGIWTRTHEEEAARAWEHYHRQTPAKRLPEKVQMVFKKIQNIMRQIYKSLTEKPGDSLVKPSKEVSALFDRWYGKEMEAAPEAKPSVQVLDTKAEVPPPLERPARTGLEKKFGKVIEVDAKRLDSGKYDPKTDKETGEGDISRTYSGDTIGQSGKIRGTVMIDGKPYVNTGGMFGPAGERDAELYRLYTPEEWGDKPVYDKSHINPETGYEGIKVTSRGKTYIMAGRDETILARIKKPTTEKVPPAAEMEAPPLSAEDRKDMEMKFQGGILPLDTGKVRVKVFADLDKARDWAMANMGKIKGAQIFALKDGRAVADFTAKNEKVLFQSDPDTERERLVAHTNVKIGMLLDKMKHVMSDAERQATNLEIRKLRERRDAAMNPPKAMAPAPGQVITLWTPEGERPIERPSGTLQAKESDTPRGAVDDTAAARQPRRAREISEPPIPPRLGESEPAAGRGTGPAPRREGKGTTAGEPRPALRNVTPVEIAPARPRGAPAYAASDWADRLEKFKLPENAPAPTVKVKPENARMMMPGQTEVVESILSGLQQHDGYILATTTGTGKCLAPGTPVLMFDGTIKNVEDVRVGDLLMGPDSKSRRVLSLAHGEDEMYRVTPKKGDAYEVNEPHILSVKMTRRTENNWGYDGKTVNIPVLEYLKKSRTWKHCAKGYRVGVEFKEQEMTLPAYWIGLWLGDGSSHIPAITTVDSEVIAYVDAMADWFGLKVRVDTSKGSRTPTYVLTTGRRGGAMSGRNYVTARMRELGILRNKHIPLVYKANSRLHRLRLLAGLIDTDGSPTSGGYDFISKWKRLADDVAFVARSLGLAAYVSPCTKTCNNNGKKGLYYRVSISGDCSVIPVRIRRKQVQPRKQKKNVLMTGIKVEHAGRGEYCGFEISGDGLFLLGDFTVTHNTYMGSAVLNEMTKPNSRNLILTPSQGLIHGRDGWIRVAGNFGVEVKPLEVGEMPTEPGTYIATWQGGLTRDGIDQVPWDLIVMDEVQEARKWWSSKRGDMSKTMGENAKKILYTSATPFHTALEMGHMGKLGLWGREGFAQWAMKNNLGVYFDKDGNLAGGAAPARLEKLRQQLIERGQFINIDRNMEGYSAHFGKVPMDDKTAKGLRDIDKALQLAENYFAASNSKGMIATTRAQRVTLAKRWLEFQRLPQAIQLGKKLEKEGWKVIFFSENKKEFTELFDFLQKPDAAMGGRISATMPKFGNTTDVLREAFGDEISIFSGKHSAGREAEKDAFNDDNKKHLYATYSAGGVGVSLHDKAGDKPRAVIYLGPPWSGISFDQALGRPWRYGTKSNVRAYFLFSDSQAEMDLVTNKVAPRMESLRAMVSGVDFKDPVVKNLRSVPENLEGALDYDHGNAHNADFDAFTKRADISGVSSYSELPIVSAKEAMHKGMKLPGGEGAQDPSVIRLWQDSPDEESLPADLEAPELTMARQVNVELADRFIETGAAPGNQAGRVLKPQERRMIADAVLARADAAASTDPASATQQVYTEWENAMKQIDAILSANNSEGMTPPPMEGVPGVPGGDGPPEKPGKISGWDAAKWYMITNGRDVIRAAAKKAGASRVGEQLARSIAQYHVESGNISGPWTTKYWDALKNNKITPAEHDVLMLTMENRKKPSRWIDNELARLRATAPMNERIERAIKEIQPLYKEVFDQMKKGNIYITVHDAATGRPRQIYYSEFSSDEWYIPHKYDYEKVHTVVDPKTGIEHKFTLRELMDKEPGEAKREAIISGMMERHGISRAAAEDFLSSQKRDVPLVGHLERAREADIPFFRTDPGAAIAYFEGAGELLARKKYFEQDGSKVKGLIAQIPDQKAREIVGGIMDSLLQRNPLQDESRALLRFASDWSVLKMAFSAIKVLGHPIHAALLTNTRSFAKGLFEGTFDYKDSHRLAELAGSINEQTKIEMLSEFGINKKGISSTMLRWNGWQGSYKWGRVVADATGRVFMTDYAMSKLLKDPKNEVVRRQLREFMQLDDDRIDRAIQRRRWTEEDLAWGGKAMADKTMFTFDKTELPPLWRARAENPAGDFGLALLRAATVLKGYQFKTHALLKDAIWDEARKGNFRPLIPFLTLYPLAGQLIWSLTSLATGNIKHFKQLMDDKSWTPGRSLWRLTEDIAHMIGDTQLTAWLDAAVHGKESLAGTIGDEYFTGAVLSDVGRTIDLPIELQHAKTKKAKEAAVKRYVEGLNPMARTLINAYEMTAPPTNSRH